LSRCRIGQTERGSYVATIIAPVPPTLTQSLFSDVEVDDELLDEPYERQVTLALMRGLQTIQGAIETGHAEAILHGVPNGVSANLCDALASMSPANPHASLELSIAWSRTRSRVPRRIRNRVSFAQGEFAVIREAGRRLRESIEPRPARVEGVVISLHAEPPRLFDDFEGRVILRAMIEGHSTRVRIVLNQAEYTQACNADRDHRRVAVTGVLQRDPQARMFDLSHPEGFQLLAADTTTPT
jgi:hypothetical protein